MKIGVISDTHNVLREEVVDYLPEGLGFLVGHTTNVDNYWSIPEDTKTVKLNTIENATKNVSIDDFADINKYEDIDVVVGKVKLDDNNKYLIAQVSTQRKKKGFMDISLMLSTPYDSPYYF